MAKNMFTMGPAYVERDDRSEFLYVVSPEGIIFPRPGDFGDADEQTIANAELGAAAFNSATQCAAMGLDGQACIEAVPELVRTLKDLMEETRRNHDPMNIKKDYSLMVDMEAAKTLLAKLAGQE